MGPSVSRYRRQTGVWRLLRVAAVCTVLTVALVACAVGGDGSGSDVAGSNLDLGSGDGPGSGVSAEPSPTSNAGLSEDGQRLEDQGQAKDEGLPGDDQPSEDEGLSADDLLSEDNLLPGDERPSMEDQRPAGEGQVQAEQPEDEAQAKDEQWPEDEQQASGEEQTEDEKEQLAKDEQWSGDKDAGYSNGGFMAYHMACKAFAGLRAVASLAGTSYLEDSSCDGAPPVSVLHIHGTADNVILYGGDEIEPDPESGDERAFYASAEDMVTRWSRRAGCDWLEQAQSHARLDLDQSVPGPETQVFRPESGCAEGISVELWAGVDSGHGPSYGDAFMDALLDWLLSQT